MTAQEGGGHSDLNGLQAEVATLQQTVKSSTQALDARLARLESGQAASISGQQQQQLREQQDSGAAGAWAVPRRTRPHAWPQAADVSLDFKVPDWAACPDPPCQFSKLQDGEPTAEVSCCCCDIGDWVLAGAA